MEQEDSALRLGYMDAVKSLDESTLCTFFLENAGNLVQDFAGYIAQEEDDNEGRLC